MVGELRSGADGDRPTRAGRSRSSLTKVCLDSLALRYASVIGTIERLTGERIEGIHIVGGGSRNDYLNQATANATGRPVLAGPVEATGLGNLLVQAVACGVTSIAEGRRRITESFPLRRLEPADERGRGSRPPHSTTRVEQRTLDGERYASFSVRRVTDAGESSCTSMPAFGASTFCGLG